MVYERLQSAREESRKTQTEVANILGITRQAYNHYETGKREPSLDTISKLATLYGVSVDYLLGKTDIKKAPAHGEQGRDEFELSGGMENLKFALFGGDGIEDIDDEMMEDVKAYARFKLQQKQKEKEKDK